MRLTGGLTKMPRDAGRDNVPSAAASAGAADAGVAAALRPSNGTAPVAGGEVAVSDEALVKRLRGGDVAAGEVLARRYYEPLMRYLQRLAGSQAAEELHQQTWLSVLDHIDRFNPATAG